MLRQKIKFFSHDKFEEITPCASENFSDCKVQHVILQIVVNTFQALLIYFASFPQEKTLLVTLFFTGGFPIMVMSTGDRNFRQFYEKLYSSIEDIL